MRRPWFGNPLGQMQIRSRTLLNQVEQTLETQATGLPPAAPWTQWLTYAILLGMTASASWSIAARIDVVIKASGKLEPQSQSQVVQSRAGGVVTAVLVREGQPVKQGQLLIQLDKTSLHNRLQGLLMQRNRLIKEIAVLRSAQMGQSLDSLGSASGGLSPELLNQVQRRLLLVAQLTGNSTGLNADQQQRWRLHQQQLRDREAIANLQAANLQTQIEQTDAQIAQTKFQLKTEQELLDRLTPLVEQGAIARVNLLQRQVSVSQLQSQLAQSDLKKQQLTISQVQSRVEDGKGFNETEQDLQRQLADLDQQFDLIVKENQKQLIEVNAQLNQVKLDLKNQDLRAPTDGSVFELATKLPGAVTQPSQALLHIVPDESLMVRVQVANADIANIRVGLPVDVRIDAYPFTEFGSVKGVVAKVGRDAVKPTSQSLGQPTFPVEIRLDRQFLARKSQQFTLTPGMTVMAMIKVRQRAPISYVTEEITKAFDGIQSVR